MKNNIDVSFITINYNSSGYTIKLIDSVKSRLKCPKNFV